MGAAALAPEVLGSCGPLAVGVAAGTACGSACALSREHCRGRVCHCRQRGACARSAACLSGAQLLGPEFDVSGQVLSVELPRGVLGVLTDNEPVVGVRAGTLPYSQAIGRMEEGWSAALVGLAGASAEGALFGNAPVYDRYTFDGFPFNLRDVSISDEVVIAFGTRTVVRIPLIGAENAPLDFTVLGTAREPLHRL